MQFLSSHAVCFVRKHDFITKSAGRIKFACISLYNSNSVSIFKIYHKIIVPGHGKQFNCLDCLEFEASRKTRCLKDWT